MLVAGGRRLFCGEVTCRVYSRIYASRGELSERERDEEEMGYMNDPMEKCA